MESIMLTTKGICFLCARHGYTERHHVFGAANRKLSDADGLTVYLCRECHEAAHSNRDIMDYLHQRGQHTWEGCYGDREAFLKRYGRNYL